MEEYLTRTGVYKDSIQPVRYLWTDAFAVFNLLELYQQTKDLHYLNKAKALVNQVHSILGRHREDDGRKGWISGLEDKEAQAHPTSGGLRIGKKLNERKTGQPIDMDEEWSRDG